MRLLTFLKRRPEQAQADFFAWWLDRHAAIARDLPGLERYVVSLSLDDDAGAAFDGVAELWLADGTALDAVFASAAGRAARDDVAAHTSRTERLQVVEHPMMDRGRGARFKLVAALKRRAELDRPAFKAWWLERHAPLVMGFPELSRYQVSLVESGEEGFVDGVAEVCFDDPETLRRVIGSTTVRSVQEDSVAHARAIHRILVEEHPIVA
jgi:uncharacterized protein (TIGR02118 family)